MASATSHSSLIHSSLVYLKGASAALADARPPVADVKANKARGPTSATRAPGFPPVPSNSVVLEAGAGLLAGAALVSLLKSSLRSLVMVLGLWVRPVRQQTECTPSHRRRRRLRSRIMQSFLYCIVS